MRSVMETLCTDTSNVSWQYTFKTQGVKKGKQSVKVREADLHWEYASPLPPGVRGLWILHYFSLFEDFATTQANKQAKSKTN